MSGRIHAVGIELVLKDLVDGEREMKNKLLLRSGCQLNGEVRINGAKNAAVALIPATVLAGGRCILENVPPVTDVKIQCEILSALGAEIQWHDNHTLLINTATVKPEEPPEGLAVKLRASYYLMGAMLGRFGHASISLPGGCKIGPRPIDQHLKGFSALGANYTIKKGNVRLVAERLMGAHVYFDIVSVGATINVMLAAAGAQGTTVIENVAREPEIVDLANFLNQIGVCVRGAGTATIRVTGSPHRHGANHSIIPDRIEAGTFLIAGAATKGNVIVRDVIPQHLDSVIAKLREAGVRVEEGDDWVQVCCHGISTAIDVKTLPYPGFPTDLQQPLASFLALCRGTSMITENIFENRFRYVDELVRMGAKIKVEGRTAVIKGVQRMQGAAVHAPDLRAGSALVIAGLCAQGETIVSGLEHLMRGYYNFDGKLKSLGAKIELV